MEHIDMTLDEFKEEVRKLGFDPNAHLELMQDMYWDGHRPQDAADMLEIHHMGVFYEGE
jgi:hypothetical protein